MPQSTQAAMSALKMAIQTEQDGQRFYRQAALQTRHPQARELFLSVAQDEVMHEQVLQARLAALNHGDGWEGVIALEPPSAVAAGPALFTTENLEFHVREYTSDLSALRMAYLLENDAVAFYEMAAAQTQDPIGKQMFLDLAAFERGHRALFETEYTALSERFKLEMGFAPF